MLRLVQKISMHTDHGLDVSDMAQDGKVVSMDAFRRKRDHEERVRRLDAAGLVMRSKTSFKWDNGVFLSETSRCVDCHMAGTPECPKHE